MGHIILVEGADMAKNTRDRILEASLELFAKNGYAATNIKDISDAVGIVKSAFYRHFASKEEAFDAVMEMMASYYEENMGSISRMPPVPDSMEELKQLTMKMVNFTVHDEGIIQSRKLLLAEQFHDERVRDLANYYFLYGTESMFTKIFSGMMEKGIIKRCDPAILAFSYTSPITALIHLCDREPARESEAMEKLKAFIDQFTAEYDA